MALPHAILVSLADQSGSGYELTRLFDRSIGHYWAASHQQIYRTLRAMEQDGWQVNLSDYDDHGPRRVRLLRQDDQGQWRVQLVVDRS